MVSKKPQTKSGLKLKPRSAGASILVERLREMTEAKRQLARLEYKMNGGEWDTPHVGDSPMDHVSDAVVCMTKAIDLTRKWFREGRR